MKYILKNRVDADPPLGEFDTITDVETWLFSRSDQKVQWRIAGDHTLAGYFLSPRDVEGPKAFIHIEGDSEE